ncbi:unnamed protein product [Prunus armeniaca]|uniref:RRM domain-containing protein n=1 Tax=Prunus armeniaca TaxID=36596 RepID=A0A6J5Y518_PRUAR|nr:unnamed protein product [Prunus armeniaca]
MELIPSSISTLGMVLDLVPSLVMIQMFTGTLLGLPLAKKEREENPAQLKQYILSKLGKIPDKVKAVVENTELDAFISSPLRYRHPWELLWGNISKGNACVSGDALHPMTPDIGQGGCCALEDSVVLARCLGEALLKNSGGERKDKEGEEGKEEYERIEMGLNKYANERRWRSFDLISTSRVVGFLQEIHYDSKQQAKFKFFWLQAWHIRSLVLESSDSLRTTGFAFSAWTNAWKALDALGIGDTLRRQHETLHGCKFELEIGKPVTDQAGMQDLGANAGDFDDDEGGGLSLNARSRAILTQKLDRSGSGSGIAGPAVNSTGVSLPMELPTAPLLGAAPVVSPLVPPITAVPGIAGLGVAGLQIPTATLPSMDTIGVPSECLLLKNMFDPAVETEPNFDLDIKEDVQEECSKYGNLRHIFVDKNTAGHVYLRFENTQAAINARHVLHGRWFAGKMIEATFMLPGKQIGLLYAVLEM